MSMEILLSERKWKPNISYHISNPSVTSVEDYFFPRFCWSIQGNYPTVPRVLPATGDVCSTPSSQATATQRLPYSCKRSSGVRELSHPHVSPKRCDRKWEQRRSFLKEKLSVAIFGTDPSITASHYFSALRYYLKLHRPDLAIYSSKIQICYRHNTTQHNLYTIAIILLATSEVQDILRLKIALEIRSTSEPSPR